MGLTAGQAKNHAQMVTCRDHVDLRVRLADALRPACLSRPGAVRMHLGTGAVEAEALHIRSVRLQIPQCREQPVEHAAARPTAESGVDRLPFSEVTRQGAPLAAVLHDIGNGVDESEVRDPHFPVLNRQMGLIFAYCFAVICFMIVHCSILFHYRQALDLLNLEQCAGLAEPWPKLGANIEQIFKTGV